MTRQGITWRGGYSFAQTIVGDIGWSDYQVSVEAMLPEQGSLIPWGRMNRFGWEDGAETGARFQRIDGGAPDPRWRNSPGALWSALVPYDAALRKNPPGEPPPRWLGRPEPYALVPVTFRAVLSVATSQMKPAANPCYETFLIELRKLRYPFIRWKGLLFRASPLEYARAAKLLDGKGGLLVPSARIAGAMNLVYFPESLDPTSEVEILGENELDRWLKKG